MILPEASGGPDRWLPGADEAADAPLPRTDGALLEAWGATPERDSGPPQLPVAWALPACAEHLRAAGEGLRALAVRDRAAGIARVARSWLDPVDPLRKEALRVLPCQAGLSEAMVAWGLDRAFEVVTEEALLRWWEDEPGEGRAVTLSGHVLSGNVFAAGLPPILASILAGVPALVKAPADQGAFATLLGRSFALHAPELGPCLGAAAWGRADRRATTTLLRACDPVFAFGDDASLAELGALAAAQGDFAPRLLGFGHRVSLGVLGRVEPTPEALRGFATDALAWNGGGCLSTPWLVVEGDAGRARTVAEAMAGALAEVASLLPAPPLPEGAGARRASWLAAEAFAGWSAAGVGWAVAARGAFSLESGPPRSLVVLPVEALEGLPADLDPLGDHLQGLAFLGDEGRGRALAEALRGQGLSRLCRPGELQRPPLAWAHDGHRILAALH